MKWLRLYHEARMDPKLEALADAHFRVWFRLLILSSEQPMRGIIDSESDRWLAAEVSRGNEDLLRETLQQLVTLRFITVTEDETPFQALQGVSCNVSEAFPKRYKRYITFKNFVKRQHESVSRNAKPSVSPSTERVRKYRERKKLERCETHETHETRDETLGKRSGNARETRAPARTSAEIQITDFKEREKRGREQDSEDPDTIHAPRPAHPVANDPAEVERIAALAERLFPMHSFGQKVHDFAPSYPIAWFREAIEDAKSRDINKWSYIMAILRDFEQRGGPPKKSHHANGRPPDGPALPTNVHRATGPRKRQHGMPRPETEEPETTS